MAHAGAKTVNRADALSAAGPAALELYRALIKRLGSLGPFQEEIKKTSIHLARGAAFAGVHPRKLYLILTIKADQPIRSPRVVKAEQVSKKRWHLDVVGAAEEIDAELMAWFRQAYELCG